MSEIGKINEILHAGTLISFIRGDDRAFHPHEQLDISVNFKDIRLAKISSGGQGKSSHFWK